MSDEERRAKEQDWRERIVRDLAELKTSSALGNQKIDSLSLQLNGRIKRLEKTVFGDEELKVIGLAEQSRVEARETKDINKRLILITAVIVFLAQSIGGAVASKAVAMLSGGHDFPLHEIHGSFEQEK